MLTATQLATLTSFCFQTHETSAKKPANAIRHWDGKTPYGVHPTWCAMTILAETRLPEFIRENGAQALLLHDILEDTTAPLPADCPQIVKSWVEGLTFPSSAVGWQEIWQRPPEVQLLKLYDATFNLLDSDWITAEKRLFNIEQIKKLVDFVTTTYGELNICVIALAICAKWQKI